ncbi:uncharacterized protein DUF4845 [Halospina denitrificans]|uniref:Uncharacterized protein DUF4845 n=2 Tax=Halospina denitrificans TaxID=332522 RepID=A0A4R7JLX3_9GAMM|nr:uncharacterized protein DUF4845 [Halospina denitrificans]
MLNDQRPPSHQGGFSMIAIMMAIIIGFFLLTVVVRVVPVYIDDFTLSQIIDSIDDRDSRRGIDSERDVRVYLKKRLRLERIESVSVSDMDIKYGNELLTIDFEYEARTPFMGNIDTVIKFEHHHEMGVQ